MELDLLGRQRRGSCDRSSPAPGRGSREDGPVGPEHEDEAGAGEEVVKGRWVQAARPGAGGVCPGGWEAQTLIVLLPESALDDLDLNEFGVAALEKTFDSSTVPHPGSITIGTGLRAGGLRGSVWPRVGGWSSALLGMAPRGFPRSPGPSRPLLQAAACCRALRP